MHFAFHLHDSESEVIEDSTAVPKSHVDVTVVTPPFTPLIPQNPVWNVAVEHEADHEKAVVHRLKLALKAKATIRDISVLYFSDPRRFAHLLQAELGSTPPA